jgi:cytochrome c oxidase assembly protein subunit 15
VVVTHRLAVVTAGATCVLILFGGLVTNTGAALAVPDWPTTFGHNMFLYPLSGMVGGVFYEHSHRLLGALVGLLTVALAAALWRHGGRLRWLGVLAVAAVILQGVLGGLRVVLLQDSLAIVHGCLAQAFFGLLAALIVLTSPRGAPAAPADPSLQALAAMGAGVVYAQIVFGALLTHAGRIDLHLVGALAVFALLPVVTGRARRAGDAVAARVSRGLLVLLAVQLLLGVGSFLSRFSSIWIPGEQITMLALPVAHRLAGSLIFGATVMLAVRLSTGPLGALAASLGAGAVTGPPGVAGPVTPGGAAVAAKGSPS